MKKLKKHLLRKQLQLQSCCQTITNSDGTKRKIRCSDDSCKHKRHKKKRKHKRHSQERDATDPQKSDQPMHVEVSDQMADVETPVDNNQMQNMLETNEEDTEETMDSYSAGDDPDFKDPVSELTFNGDT